MDAGRFQTLAGAFGGDIARWPLRDQAAARAFMADDRRATTWLNEASGLDSLLDAIISGPQNDLLRERIIRSAPKPGAGFAKRTVWVSWAGLAAACAAGIICGAQITATTTSGFDDPTVQATVESSTAFADSSLSDAIEGEVG